MTACSRLRALAVAGVTVLGITDAMCASNAAAGSLTAKDIQILGRALGLLEPPASGTATVGIVVAPDQPASKAEADAILAAFGDGVKGGDVTFKARLVELSALGSATDLAALIATSGTAGDAVMAAAKARHIPCVTADVDQVKAGHCMISVQSAPRVEITLSRDAAAAAGVGFASSFRMMVHEI